MSDKKTVLAIVSHPDDEILGVGGTLLKHTGNKDEVHILILSDGETSRDFGCDINKRTWQAKRVAQKLGARSLFLKNFPNNKFDTVPLLTIIKEIEKAITVIKPEIIYTHSQTDLNIDHRLTCEAVMVACRPQPGSLVKKILTFETLSSTEWQIKDKQNAFCPNCYSNITGLLEIKQSLMSIYQDELRHYPHPRSLDGIRILAEFRGLESGCKHAEAFVLIREINK